jgi:anti-sigma factor RsiW
MVHGRWFVELAEGATMKCEWVRENIVLQVYGELADDARHELEQHVARCADCAAELKRLRPIW